MLSGTLFVFAVFLLMEAIRRRYETFQYFKKLGIPGPRPHFLWGHFREFRDDHIYWLNKWTKQYGDTFGAFWGDKPLLVTRDLGIQRQVLISKFSNFVNRADLFSLENAHPVTREMLSLLKDNKWKQIRSVLSPAFSTSRLKQMTPLILKSAKMLESNFEPKCAEESFDFYPLLKRFTLNNIGHIIFGIETDCQTNVEIQSPLFKAALKAVNDFLTTNVHLICSSFNAVNQLVNVLANILLCCGILEGPLDDFAHEARKIVQARRNAPPRNDLMQILLNSAQDSANKAHSPFEEKKQTTLLKMTENDIVGNSTVMLMAGYETTSSALAFILCCLARHKDVQQRLRKELNEALKGKEPSYDTVMSANYLDRVVKETLRLYPPVTGFTTRQSTSEVEINGMKIPAGLFIYFPTGEIHHDDRLWKDPLSFNPDRFLDSSIEPLAYQPFGNGPRNCIGMRVALLTIKLAISNIITKFEISAEDEIQVKSKAGIIAQPHEARMTVRKLNT